MGMTASIAAAICVVRAKAHSLQMNIAKCVYWYTAALKRDALCTEALDVLCSHYLLSKAEQLKLVDSLDTKDYGEWLRMLYQVKLPAVLSPAARLATAKKLKVEYGMKQTHDLTYVEARACSDRFDLTRSLSLTTPVINKGVMHEDCIILHAITLYRLDKEPELYLLGHKLSEDYPNSQIGLFVVGCYYLLQAKKNDSRTKRALVYFEKSVSKSWYFLPGWMGYAFAYALKSSTDEVLRAYSRAERFAPGSHYLPLCTGMEYLATNQVALAFRYLKLAKSLCSTDPMVHHELGIAAYRMGEVEKAASHLTRVLDLLRQYDDRIVDERDYCHVDFLEPLYCNLGHVMRRRECYSEAVEYFKRAIALRPKHAANYSALGLTYAMMGSDALAIDVLHTALSLSPFEKYASELLDKLMNWMADVNVDEAVGMMTSSFSCI
uniref:Uncharacterized protein n=1 Tax=Palpitomonas bilix TaxID=652834 RepID=A0A7S3DBL9_9EUKA